LISLKGCTGAIDQFPLGCLFCFQRCIGLVCGDAAEWSIAELPLPLRRTVPEDFLDEVTPRWRGSARPQMSWHMILAGVFGAAMIVIAFVVRAWSRAFYWTYGTNAAPRFHNAVFVSFPLGVTLLAGTASLPSRTRGSRSASAS
jgi:hypothetical protein